MSHPKDLAAIVEKCIIDYKGQTFNCGQDALAYLHHAITSACLEYSAAETKRADKLKNALNELMAYQNGCPLPCYKHGWNNAMKLAQAALKETK